MVVVVLLIAGGVGYTYYRFSQVRRQQVAGLAASAGASQPMNILLVGNSCRTCLNGKQASAFGTAAAQGNGGGADVEMILHLDPKTRTASLVSIPRDTFVPVLGTTRANRINSALDTGSSTLVKTIEADFGVPINHYMELNFDTFQNAIAALGGLDMRFPYPVKDTYSGLNVPAAGCYSLTPFQALAVVRARHLQYKVNGVWHYDGLGDLSRIQRDHEFLRVLADQVRSKGLSNPLTLNRVATSLSADLKLDSRFSFGTFTSLLRRYRSVRPSTIPTDTLPIVINNKPLVYRGVNYGDVLFPAQPNDIVVLHQKLGLAIPAIARGTTVQVDNGSGIASQAATTASSLAALGEKVTSVGNATVASSPAETILYYSPGHQAQALALMNHLSGEVAMGQMALSHGTDLRLVTGSNFSVLTSATVATGSSAQAPRTPAPSKSTSTSAPTTTTPASSGSSGASFGSVPFVYASAGATKSAPWNPTACAPGQTAKPLMVNRKG